MSIISGTAPQDIPLHVIARGFDRWRAVMRIIVGSDRKRWEHRKRIEYSLIEQGHLVEDFGVNQDESWNRIVESIADTVSQGGVGGAILLGETGNDEAIVANRVPGIWCVVCWNAKSARLTKRHCNANVLAIGAGLFSFERTAAIVESWLETPYSPKRHARGRATVGTVMSQRKVTAASLPHRTPMIESTAYLCKNCGHEFEIPIDLSAGCRQEQFEECPVCFHENVIHVGIDDDGGLIVEGSQDDS